VPDRLRVGTVGRAQGISGAFRVEGAPAWCPFAPGSELFVGGVARRLRSARREGRRLVLALEGVDGRDAAEALRGEALELDRAQAPEPEPDAFWVSDLVGCRVVCGGDELGVVREVLELPANDVLVVERPGEDLLLPFTRDAIPEVDLEGRRLELRGDFLPDDGEG
jgi:16S rRNA processing protein RimM